MSGLWPLNLGQAVPDAFIALDRRSGHVMASLDGAFEVISERPAPSSNKKGKKGGSRDDKRRLSDEEFERALQAQQRKKSVSLVEVMQSIENYHFCDDPYAVCAEFFGTYIFLFATTLAVTYSGGQVFNIGTSYGLTLAVVIFITGPISGGHINPAVTFALTLHRILDWKMALYYVAAQLLGAVCGVATAYGISDELIGSIFVNERVSPAAGFFGEAIGTFVLVLTVYATAVHTGKGETSRTKEIHNGLAPFVIGLAVWAMHFSLVGVTGCGINPARFFGTAVVLNRWNGYEWVYIIGPLFGALMTFPVQKVLYRAASEASRDAADAECQDDQV